MSRLLEGRGLVRWLDADPKSEDAGVGKFGPDLAQALMPRNVNNRPIYNSKVALYADNMRQGLWPFTSQAIAFDRDGNLHNGQHRLTAVILSGATVEMVVTKGHDPKSFVFEDIHIKRSLVDMLCILKETNYKHLGGALAHLYRYFNQVKARQGVTRRTAIEGLPAQDQRLATFTSYAATAQLHEALSLLDEHPGLRDSVSACASYQSALVPPSMLAVLHYLGVRVDRRKTEAFLETLVAGTGGVTNAPVVHLTRQLQAASVSKARVLRPERRMGLCLKALRLTLLGRQVGNLVLHPAAKDADGKTIRGSEEFPLLEDLVGADADALRRIARIEEGNHSTRRTYAP